MDYLPGEDHTIERPRDYDFWHAFEPNFCPEPQLGWVFVDPATLDLRDQSIFEGTPGEGADDLWDFRRILFRGHYPEGRFGRAAPDPDREPPACVQEHRRHAHHERLLSAPPRRVERREAAGALAAFCMLRRLVPRQVRSTPAHLAELQHVLASVLGIELAWPNPRATPR
jgi:hypothetical protein